MVEPDLTDEFLDFGAMCMVQGAAFPLGVKRLGEWDQPGTVSGKSWLHLDGRTFLVEKVDYTAIKDQLDRLPKTAAAVPKRKAEQLMAARPEGGIQRPFPAAKKQVAAKASKPIQMARASLLQKGFVLDYTLQNAVDEFYVPKRHYILRHEQDCDTEWNHNY